MSLTQKVAYRKGQKVTADVINDTVNTAVESYSEATKAVEIAKQADARERTTLHWTRKETPRRR